MHIWTCVSSQLCRLLLLLPVLHFSYAVNRLAHPQSSGTSNPHTVDQAWRTFCSSPGHDCSQGVAPPKTAYIISLPEDTAKRKHLERSLQELGLSTEVVDAIPSDQLGSTREFLECKPALGAYDCQAGLTRSHIEAWQRLAKSGESAAWVFEDDAVFHDNFLSLFPEYWQRVPKAFQFVFLGHVYWGSVWDDAIVHLAPQTSPWGTHAYIVSAETAERLALLGSHMIERARRHAFQRASFWQLDGHDVKIDHFIKVYYDSLLPERQRASWAVFESPAGRPWSYGGVTAAHSNDCNCRCSDIGQCLADGKSPLIWPNGLVAQHNCSTAIEHLTAWEKKIRSVPPSRLCNSTKTGRSEHLDMPQLPLLMGVLRPVPAKAGARGKGSSQQH